MHRLIVILLTFALAAQALAINSVVLENSTQSNSFLININNSSGSRSSHISSLPDEYGSILDTPHAKNASTGSFTLKNHFTYPVSKNINNSSGSISHLSFSDKRCLALTFIASTGSFLLQSNFKNRYGYVSLFKQTEHPENHLIIIEFKHECDVCSMRSRSRSPDPLGYVDGMSLYNGYFAERFGLDPTGTKEVSKDKCRCKTNQFYCDNCKLNKSRTACIGKCHSGKSCSYHLKPLLKSRDSSGRFDRKKPSRDKQGRHIHRPVCVCDTLSKSAITKLPKNAVLEEE